MNEALFQEAKKYIPGGVNSPVRAFRAVGGAPKFIARAKGPYIWDAEGRKYLDFVASWGPLILGHADPGIVRAISQQARKGTSYGAPTKNEIDLAKLIRRAFPSMEQVRLVSSGTEAVMSAIRLARGATNRKKIIKIDGGYHGHADSLLVKAGSGALTFGVPDSQGVPEELSKLTYSIPFNNIDALEKLLAKDGDEIACFILEPVPANMGVILPKESYLREVRRLTQKYGVQLIFDEVISGFRLAFGGAQERFGIRPDLTCLGKVLGGGLPIAAFGGRKDVMARLAPEGGVYQAGTLSGNPLATRAGIEMLKRLMKYGFYDKLEDRAESFYEVLQGSLRSERLPVGLNRIGSCFTLFFNDRVVTDYESAKQSNTARYAKFFHALLKRGIYFAPSQFEANFISTTHTPKILAQAAKTIVDAARSVSS